MKNRSRNIFQNRNFLDYLGMNLSSGTAGAVTNVSVIWFVFAVTRSAVDVAVVGLAASIATVVVALPAGVWIDRHDRRSLLLLSNTVRAACLILLALITVAAGFQLLAVVIFSLVWNGANELYRSTDASVLPELVEPDKVAGANGVTRAGYSLLGSFSSALGGALIVLAGAVLAFGYSAAGYAVAAAFSLFLLLRHRGAVREREPNAVRKKAGMGREIGEGMRWLIRQRGLFELSLSAVVFNFLFGVTFYFLVIYVGDAVGAGAFLFGAVLAAFVIGSAAGSLAVRWTDAIRHAGKVWLLGNGVCAGALMLLLGVLPSVTVALGASFGIGLATSFGGTVWLTSAQNLVPTAMRGRYFAIDGLLSFIGGPPAIVAGGILITLLGVVKVYEIAGAFLLFSALAFTLMKDLWRLDGRSDAGIGMTVEG